MYLIGLLLCVIAVVEIAKMNISTAGKVISIILVLLTNWIGLAVYYLYARRHLHEWFR